MNTGLVVLAVDPEGRYCLGDNLQHSLPVSLIRESDLKKVVSNPSIYFTECSYLNGAWAPLPKDMKPGMVYLGRKGEIVHTDEIKVRGRDELTYQRIYEIGIISESSVLHINFQDRGWDGR